METTLTIDENITMMVKLDKCCNVNVNTEALTSVVNFL